MPLIGSIVTWPPPSAIPTSKLSVILQPIASVSLVPTGSAIPFLDDRRGLGRAFQVLLVLFVSFCESAGKHLFKVGNSFRSVCHPEIQLGSAGRVEFLHPHSQRPSTSEERFGSGHTSLVLEKRGDQEFLLFILTHGLKPHPYSVGSPTCRTCRLPRPSAGQYSHPPPLLTLTWASRRSTLRLLCDSGVRDLLKRKLSLPLSPDGRQFLFFLRYFAFDKHT